MNDDPCYKGTARMYQRIEELEQAITANDKELQELYADNERLQGENDMLRKAIRALKEVAGKIFDIADSGCLMELTVEKEIKKK